MLRCIGRRRLRSVVDGGRRSLCEAVGENDLTSMVGGAVPLAMDLLPEGVASPIARHFSLLGRSSLLVRDVDVKLNDEIDRAVVDGRVVRKGFATVLSGEMRCGKSAALLRAVEQRRKKGWLVLYIRNADDWTSGKFFYNGAYDSAEEREQGMNPLWYDRPTQTKELLLALKQVHGKILGDLVVKRDTPVRAQMGGETLLDMINYGLNRLEKIDEDWENIPRLAGDVLEALIEEIIAVDDVPTLIAVDSYDSFFGVSNLFNHKDKKMISQSFRVSWPLRVPKETANRMQNGIFLAARSSSHIRGLKKGLLLAGCRRMPMTKELAATLRKDPNDKSHMQELSRGIRFEVPRFTKEDTRALLQHINQVGFVRDKIEPKTVTLLHSMSQGCPEQVMLMTKTL